MSVGIIYVHPSYVKDALLMYPMISSMISHHINENTVFVVGDFQNIHANNDGVMFLDINSLGILSLILLDFFKMIKRGIPIRKALMGLTELLSREN